MSQPLYKTIYEKLKFKIETGVYSYGDILPTEKELCAIYHASRVTIRKALELLSSTNYINTVQGSGSYIIYAKNNLMMRRSGKIIPFTQEMKAKDKTPTVTILDFKMIKASKELAEDLEINRSDLIFYYERLLLADDFPYLYEEGYMPVETFEDLSLNILKESKLNYIEKTKEINILYSQQSVHAIMPTEKLSKHLQVSINAPLLLVDHITYDNENKPIEKVRDIYDSKIYEATFTKFRLPN